MSLHLGIIYTILARHFSTCCIFFNKFVQCNSGRIPYWAIRLSSQWGSFEQITFNRKRVTNTEPDFSFKGAKIEDWDMLIAYHKLLSIFQMLMLLYLFVQKKKKKKKICTASPKLLLADDWNNTYSLMAYYMKIRLEIRVSLFCSEINFENFRQINGKFTDATIFPLPRQRK